jgi:hypothetical protein
MRNSRLTATITVLVTLLAMSASTALSADVERYTFKKHSFDLGGEFGYRKYNEPGLMQEKGWTYGLAGSYAYHNRLVLKLEGRGNYADMTYDGGMGGSALHQSDVPDYLVEGRAIIGYDFPVWKATVLTYYTGIGYRYLNDDSSEFVGGYERESNYVYSPLGIAFATNLGNNWSIVETLEYDLFWRGKQESHLSDASSMLPDITNKQHDGYGYRGSITAEKKFERIIFQAGAFFRKWSINESDIEIRDIDGTPIAFWEPKNNTTEYGITLGARF